MKGLIKSNLYASLSNIKMFSVIIILVGILGVVIGQKFPSFIINYTLLSMMGFSLNAIGGIQKENTSKWEMHKLTAPVKRADIVKSYYLCHVLWILIGIFFAAFFISLSIGLHGFLFDKKTDVLMIFTAGASVGLLIGAIFFPIFYIGGSERFEASWVISILFSIGIYFGITGAVNYLFAPMSDLQLMISAVIFIMASACLFVLSYFLSVALFRRKEY